MKQQNVTYRYLYLYLYQNCYENSQPVASSASHGDTYIVE